MEEPIPINGWEEHNGPEDRNPPGKLCFKQRYYVEKIVYETARKCNQTEEESCGLVFYTKFRTVQVNDKAKKQAL